MHEKQFIKLFFIAAFSLISSVGLFNFFMDPNWTFSHSHRYNNMQSGFNERLQKSNMLYFREANYNALLLGSSRVTFFNQYDFKNSHIFNYSFSLASPEEYKDYIDFAKMRNKGAIKKIYIGVDFFGSNKNFHNSIKPKEIFESVTSCCYRYRMLFSVDSFKTSLFNLKASIANNPGYRSYKRNNITMSKARNKAFVKKDVKNKKVSDYMGNIDTYQYNSNYFTLMQKLKNENADSEFVIFTTPTSAVYLHKIFALGYKEEYKKWLRDLVKTFGKIYHFMYFNTISNNYENYFIDYHHLYPKYTKWVVDRLEERANSKIPKDFGLILNQNNIELYLKTL